MGDEDMPINSRAKGKEIWKDIPEYEGYYLASSFGRIKSLPRTTTWGGIMVPYISKHNGYVYVALSKNGKSKTYRLHKLIYQTFIGDTPNKYDKYKTINHIDGDKTNNRVENLEMNTQSENQLHAYKLGLQIVKNNRMVIRNDGKIYFSIMDAKRDIDGQTSKIYMCCHLLRKHHRGYSFRYYEGGDISAYKF